MGMSTLRQLETGEVGKLRGMLKPLEVLYPGFDKWFRRFEDRYAAGRSTCTVAHVGPDMAGVTIETPKSIEIVKLSTIYVAPMFRRRGVGTQLMEACCKRWRRQDLYVTVASTVIDEVRPFLTRFNFINNRILLNRYGPGRDEYILERGSDLDYYVQYKTL